MDDDEQFRQAMAGVEPIAPGPERVSVRRRTRRAPAGSQPGRRFDVQRTGERIEGLALAADRRQLDLLLRDQVAVDARVDLHRLREDDARRLVTHTIEVAYRAGRRCVLVIHGHGLGRSSAPVLKEALPAWLMAPPLAGRVVAFASAPPPLGGVGATLVLLRRKRSQGGGGTG